MTLEESLEVASEQKRSVVVLFYEPASEQAWQYRKRNVLLEHIVSSVQEVPLFVQIDVAADPLSALQAKVDSCPALFVYRERRAYWQSSEYASPERVRMWVLVAQTGLPPREGLRAIGSTEDVWIRNELAKTFQDLGAYDEALAHYLWLWSRSVESNPAWAAARQVGLPERLKSLCQASINAKLAFEQLRKSAFADISVDRRSLLDWFTLSYVVDKEQESIEWTKANIERAGAVLADTTQGRRTFWLLCGQQLYEVAGAILGDSVETAVDVLGQLHDETESEVGDHARGVCVVEDVDVYRRCAQVYRACLAAGRNSEAVEVADAISARDEQGFGRLALLSAAVEAGMTGSEQRKWAVELRSLGISLGTLERKLGDN